jgi:flagellar protein FlgJ
MKNYGIYYQNLNELINLSKRDPKEALKRACSEFESLLWYEILKGLDNTIIKSNFFPETLERKIFQDYLYQEIARSISGRPGSLGDYLYKNLIKSSYFKYKTTNADNK